MTTTKLTFWGGSRRQYRWFNVFKFKWPKMTTWWSYRESGTSAWRCLDCKMVLQRWVCQMSKGGFWSSPSRRRNRLHGSCILPSRKLSIQKSFETKWSLTTIDDYLQGPTWPFKTVWVNHWSQIQNGTIWPIRSQQWFDKRSQWTSFQTFTFQS